MIDLTEQWAIECIGSVVSPVLPEGKQSEEVTCQAPSAVQPVCVPQFVHEEATVSANLTQSVVLNRLGSLDSGNDRALELLRDADTAITVVADSSNFLLPDQQFRRLSWSQERTAHSRAHARCKLVWESSSIAEFRKGSRIRAPTRCKIARG